jgi:hypothetical protein
MRKGGQLQIGESMITIILILMIGALVLVFAFNSGRAKDEDKAQERESEATLETARVVVAMYELRCVKTGATETCIDAHKAQAFAALWRDYETLYQPLLGGAEIRLVEVFPRERTLLLYNGTVPGRNDPIKRTITIPLTIHNVTAGTNAFGVLEVTR